MPKKSRRNKLKRQRPANPQTLTVKEPSQSPQVIIFPSKQKARAKSPVTVEEQTNRYQYVLSDLRRSIILAVVILIILFVLYFLLR